MNKNTKYNLMFGVGLFLLLIAPITIIFSPIIGMIGIVMFETALDHYPEDWK